MAAIASKSAPSLAAGVPLYKDLGKDAKDVLTKDYSTCGEWKVEHKSKAKKGDYVINPVASNDGKVRIDVEGMLMNGVQVKVDMTPEDLKGLKAAVTYVYRGNKLEGSLARSGDNARYELTHSTSSVMGGMVSVFDKFNNDGAEIGVVAVSGPGVLVGGGATYGYKGKDVRWTAGCQAKMSMGQVTLRTQAMETYTASVLGRVAISPVMVPRIAAEFQFDPKRVKKAEDLKVKGGVEMGCPFIPGNVLKARIDESKNWAVTYVAKLTGQWTAAITVDRNCKTGVQLTSS